MMGHRPKRRERGAILPWLLAGFAWFGLIGPMREDQTDRLSEQSRIRRDRIKADRGEKDNRARRGRVVAALKNACGASDDPVQLRERTVMAADGLSLTSFSLAVSGGPGAGTQVEAEGTREEVLQLVSRLGDPGRGSFLRNVALRNKGSRWSVTLTTGVLGPSAGSVAFGSRPCVIQPAPAARDEASEREEPAPRNPNPRLMKPSPPADVPEAAPPPLLPEPVAAPPFALVAFLSSGGERRVSLRVADEIRVVAVGDQVSGWKCLSVDRDEGAVFVSVSGERLVLRHGL